MLSHNIICSIFKNDHCKKINSIINPLISCQCMWLWKQKLNDKQLETKGNNKRLKKYFFLFEKNYLRIKIICRKYHVEFGNSAEPLVQYGLQVNLDFTVPFIHSNIFPRPFEFLGRTQTSKPVIWCLKFEQILSL